GDNAHAQLGDGTTTQRLTPVTIAGVTAAITVDAGRWHTCTYDLAGGGSVKCWGDNSLGELGDGTTTNRSTPVVVASVPSGYDTVVAGYWHTCALPSFGGTIKCWGYNVSGQIGDGTTFNRLTPVDVTGLPTGLAAGESHTCALTTSGGVK